MRFGDLLQHARHDHGLSLLDLSERTGIAKTNLHRMEVGERPPPKPEKITDITRAIGMDGRSSALLLWLVNHEMTESLAHLALQERTVPLEDFQTASLMRFIHVSADALSKATWLRVVHHIAQAREGAEREASLSVARDWPEVKKGE